MGFEYVKDEKKKTRQEDITLPKRNTKTSAGYDFYAPEDVSLMPRGTYKMWTDVKVKLNKDEVLLILPRSSQAIKKGLVIANTIGVIDSDYYNNSDNDGNICIALYNRSIYINDIKHGDKIAQGLIVKYQTFGDIVNTSRAGGIGSTDEMKPNIPPKKKPVKKRVKKE